MVSDFGLELDLESISGKQMFGLSYWDELFGIYFNRQEDIDSNILREYFHEMEAKQVLQASETRSEHIFAIPEVALKVNTPRFHNRFK